MKKAKILFWVATVILFIFEGLMPIFTVHSPAAVAGFTGLGYPVYFIMMLSVFKLLGGLALIIPQVPANVKEWAYAGFAIDFLSAFISITVVAGLGAGSFLPIIALLLLILSYTQYKKLHRNN